MSAALSLKSLRSGSFRLQLFVALLGWTGISAPLGAQDMGKFDLRQLRPDVYVAEFRDPLAQAVDANAVIVINEHDVLVVDAQQTPAATRAVIAEIRKLTSKPVRWVVNTHWHGDHHFGNLVYAEEYPGVEFIAHETMRVDATTTMAGYLDQMKATAVPQAIEAFRRQLAQVKSGAAQGDTTFLQTQIREYEWFLDGIRQVTILPATLEITNRLVLRRGGRTIEILHLGRGNTQGDVIVHLPQEKMVFTGDVLVNPIPYAFGSFPTEWLAVLRQIQALGATTIVPGHGAPQRDGAYLALVIEAMQAARDSVRVAVGEGLSLEDTRARVTLSAFRERFAGTHRRRLARFDDYFRLPFVDRAYAEAKGEIPGAPGQSSASQNRS